MDRPQLQAHQDGLAGHGNRPGLLVRDRGVCVPGHIAREVQIHKPLQRTLRQVPGAHRGLRGEPQRCNVVAMSSGGDHVSDSTVPRRFRPAALVRRSSVPTTASPPEPRRAAAARPGLDAVEPGGGRLAGAPPRRAEPRVLSVRAIAGLVGIVYLVAALVDLPRRAAGDPRRPPRPLRHRRRRARAVLQPLAQLLEQAAGRVQRTDQRLRVPGPLRLPHHLAALLQGAAVRDPAGHPGRSSGWST